MKKLTTLTDKEVKLIVRGLRAAVSSHLSFFRIRKIAEESLPGTLDFDGARSSLGKILIKLSEVEAEAKRRGLRLAKRSFTMLETEEALGRLSRRVN